MMENNKTISLFKYISSAIVDGELPRDFSLPKLTDDESEIAWADGAMDGVGIYHIGFRKMSDEDYALMVDAIWAAAKGEFDKADEMFIRLGNKTHAIFAIDALQSYIIDHKDELTAENIYEYGFHALVDSLDRECVKYGLSLLELFNTDRHEELKDVVRTIGLSDEFSIFSIYVMLQWEDGNNEVWQLAKKIHGWGRIHAVERIEPVTDEIKKWLLLDGVHNDVMPVYSALTCWQKADAETVLRNNPTREEFSGIRDIIDGLLNEGPVLGISKIENREDVILTFLKIAKQMALELEDYETIRSIRIHFEDGDSNRPEIVSLCQELLSTDDCKKAVSDAVKVGRDVVMAKELNLDYKADIFALLNASFESKNHLCSVLMDDPEYKDNVMALFRQQLPLSEMKTQPTKSLGLGREYWRQSALEYMMQELRKYPLEGQDFVETALQSAPIRTRNGGLNVLEMWSSEKGIPLSKLLPKFQELLCQLREIEPDDNVKMRMDRLISGSIIFGDEK